MSDLRVIRSYQRIFEPQRRLYQIDGRRLPLPNGVALSWLGWFAAALLVILVLQSRSLPFTITAGILATGVGRSLRDWRVALLLGGGVFAGAQLMGLVLGWVDWPLRFLVLPGVLASMAGHVTPDGRSAYRYLYCRLAVRLRAARHSLDRPVFVDGEEVLWGPRVWVAPDHRFPVLQHGRVHGPARLVFAQRVVLTRGRGRVIARPLTRGVREGEVAAQVVELGAGQVVEVRP